MGGASHHYITDLNVLLFVSYILFLIHFNTFLISYCNHNTYLMLSTRVHLIKDEDDDEVFFAPVFTDGPQTQRDSAVSPLQ